MEVIEEGVPRLSESEWQGMKRQGLRGRRGDNGCGGKSGYRRGVHRKKYVSRLV